VENHGENIVMIIAVYRQRFKSRTFRICVYGCSVPATVKKCSYCGAYLWSYIGLQRLNVRSCFGGYELQVMR